MAQREFRNSREKGDRAGKDGTRQVRSSRTKESGANRTGALRLSGVQNDTPRSSTNIGRNDHCGRPKYQTKNKLSSFVVATPTPPSAEESATRLFPNARQQTQFPT